MAARSHYLIQNPFSIKLNGFCDTIFFVGFFVEEKHFSACPLLFVFACFFIMHFLRAFAAIIFFYLFVLFDISIMNEIFMLATFWFCYVLVSLCTNNLLRYHKHWHQLIVVGIIYSLILITAKRTKNPLHSIIGMFQIFFLKYEYKSRFVFSTDLCGFLMSHLIRIFWISKKSLFHFAFCLTSIIKIVFFGNVLWS